MCFWFKGLVVTVTITNHTLAFVRAYTGSYEPVSKLLVSPSISPMVVPYIMPYRTPFKEFRL